MNSIVIVSIIFFNLEVKIFYDKALVYNSWTEILNLKPWQALLTHSHFPKNLFVVSLFKGINLIRQITKVINYLKRVIIEHN